MKEAPFCGASFLISISIIASWEKLLCNLDVVDNDWVIGVWDLTCDFLGETADFIL
jgi:hypothetical protein